MATTDTASKDAARTGTVFSPTFGHLHHPFLITNPSQLSGMNEIFRLVDVDETAELGEDGHILEICVTSGTIEEALADGRGQELAVLLGDVFKYTGTVYIDDTGIEIGYAHGDPTYEVA